MESVSWEDRDGARWIQLEGELDHDACLDIGDRFREAVGAGEADVIVVMAGVTFLSSMGIGMLAKAREDLARKGRVLKLQGLKPSLRGVLESMNLMEVFEEL